MIELNFMWRDDIDWYLELEKEIADCVELNNTVRDNLDVLPAERVLKALVDFIEVSYD